MDDPIGESDHGMQCYGDELTDNRANGQSHSAVWIASENNCNQRKKAHYTDFKDPRLSILL